MIAQRDQLEHFFHPDRWRSSMEQFPLSGFALVDRIASLSPRFVVDAGCGYHEFRGRIPNCLGIDLVNPAADLVCNFQDAPIRDGSIDVVLALGSINFGDVDDVTRDLATVAGWLRPGGTVFMRVNPGQDLPDPSIVVFPWTPERAETIGGGVGLELTSTVLEESIEAPWGAPAQRLHWTYVKRSV